MLSRFYRLRPQTLISDYFVTMSWKKSRGQKLRYPCSRVHAYKNGKTMEQCREEARKNTEMLSNEILKIQKFHGQEYKK